LPLIVLSADRTANRIDQKDSQTIRQHGALAAVVKASYDISEADDKSFVNRKLNDAIQTALTAPQAPVHINVQISEPLNGMIDVSERDFRKVGRVRTECTILPDEMQRHWLMYSNQKRKVMFLVGFHSPDSQFEQAMSKFGNIG